MPKKTLNPYHKHQLEAGFEDQPSGVIQVIRLIRPINRVRCLCAWRNCEAYPSSVLMNVIPAKIAGVKEIIMITPQEHFVPAILVARQNGWCGPHQDWWGSGVCSLGLWYGGNDFKVDKITESW